jgi:4-hydroxybenzoate polyprenyltransferase
VLRDLVKLARPRDWLKSAFIALPVPFAWVAGAQLDPGIFLLGVVGFSLLASAVYAVNDVLDADRDRLHPKKFQRPVAAGTVSPAAALVLSAVLCSVGIAALFATRREGAVSIGVTYLALNAGYSLGWKHIPLVDVFVLSSGFVLRVFLGCALVAVLPSSWLLLCSSALALLLALGKRRGELAAAHATEHRPSLAGYDRTFIELAMAVIAATALVGYSLYSIEAKVLLPGREFATLPFVWFGVLEYLRLSIVEGRGGSPVDAILHSRALLATGVGWLVATAWSVGLF